jgi:hypothetical protein
LRSGAAKRRFPPSWTVIENASGRRVLGPVAVIVSQITLIGRAPTRAVPDVALGTEGQLKSNSPLPAKGRYHGRRDRSQI